MQKYSTLSTASVPAVLLAAGQGTRLRPLTDTIPKCLVPILGRPLLAFWIEQCLNAKMYPIIINLSYLSEKVEAFLDSYPLYLKYKKYFILAYEEELQGTGGTLLSQKHILEKGSFFVAHADNLSLFSIESFYSAHKHRPDECFITAMSFTTQNPQSCGVFELDSCNVVQAFHEKVANPPSCLANGAVYFMEPKVFDILNVSDSVKPDISLDLLPYCLGHIYTFHNTIYHRDIGTPESYTKAQQDMEKIFKPHIAE